MIDLQNVYKLYEVASKCDGAINISKMTFGINVKMLDYYSLGIPVLANENGVRGYGSNPYVHYIPADTSDFEEKICFGIKRHTAGRLS